MKGLRLQPGKAWGGLRSAQRCRQRICWACAAPFERQVLHLVHQQKQATCVDLWLQGGS